MRLQHPVFAEMAQLPALDVIDKRLLVRFGLETDDVVAAHRLDQLFVRRHRAQDFRHGKRNMQEKADRILDARRPAFLRERQQVIVVHPDDVVGLEQRLELFRQRLVHPRVTGIFLTVEARQVIAVMKRRPQRRVGKAAVVLVVIAPGQPDRRIRHVATLLDHRRRCLTHNLAAPAEPHAACLLQRVQNADRQTARSGFAFLDRRDTIRYHDQSAHYCFTSSVVVARSN